MRGRGRFSMLLLVGLSAVVAMTASCQRDKGSDEDDWWCEGSDPEDPPYRLGLNNYQFDATAPADWADGLGKTLLEAQLDDAEELGSTGLRQLNGYDLGWSTVYDSGDYDDASSYDFTNADEAIDAALDRDMVVIVTLFGNSVDTGSMETPDGEVIDVGDSAIAAKVEGYLTVVANRYLGDITYWEIGNEVFNTTYSMADYADLVEFCADVLRDIDSDNRIVIGGLAGTADGVAATHLGEFETFLGVVDKGAFDIVNVHYYDDYDQLADYLEDVVDLMDDEDITCKPLWATEIGASYINDEIDLLDASSSQEEQARDVFRKFSVCFGKGVQLVHWHTHFSKQDSPNWTWAGLGLRKPNGDEVLSWYSYQLFAQTLGGFVTCTELSAGAGNVWAYQFDAPTACWVLWTDSASSVSYTLTSGSAVGFSATETVSDEDGVFTTTSHTGSSVTLSLSQTPLLVVASYPSATSLSSDPEEFFARYGGIRSPLGLKLALRRDFDVRFTDRIARRIFDAMRSYEELRSLDGDSTSDGGLLQPLETDGSGALLPRLK